MRILSFGKSRALALPWVGFIVITTGGHGRWLRQTGGLSPISYVTSHILWVARARGRKTMPNEAIQINGTPVFPKRPPL